jgi:hypothetical protein
MKRLIIIHGWEGTPDNGWKPWLKNEAEKIGFEVFSPQMPGGKYPKLEEWLSLMNKLIKKADKHTYLIGHSLGCVTVARYLENLPKETKVGGAIFVAGFSDDLDSKETHNFTEKPLNADKVRSHTKKLICISSEDDKWVPFKIAKKFQEQLKAKLILDNGKGHFSGSEGINELPSALNALMEISK